MEILDFEAFLRLKKIDPIVFRKEDQVLFEEFRNIYELVHPESFTAQKLFQINRVRRKYPFTPVPSAETPSAPGIAKPKISFKPKIS